MDPTGGPQSGRLGAPHIDTAVELEDLGYQTIWLTGGPLESLSQIVDVVRATKRARVASGIISVDRFGAGEVSALYTGLQATHPGRFVVGLGGAHGPNPLQTLTGYLDRLEAVPATARVMAALGPKMLDLARRRAAGAFPVLVTPGYTASARSLVGEDTTLAVEQLVVVGTDPQRARAVRSDSSGKSPPTRPASAGWGLPARRSPSSAIALSTRSCPGAAPIPWQRPLPGSCGPEPTTSPFR